MKVVASEKSDVLGAEEAVALHHSQYLNGIKNLKTSYSARFEKIKNVLSAKCDEVKELSKALRFRDSEIKRLKLEIISCNSKYKIKLFEICELLDKVKLIFEQKRETTISKREALKSKVEYIKKKYSPSINGNTAMNATFTKNQRSFRMNVNTQSRVIEKVEGVLPHFKHEKNILSRLNYQKEILALQFYIDKLLVRIAHTNRLVIYNADVWNLREDSRNPSGVYEDQWNLRILQQMMLFKAKTLLTETANLHPLTHLLDFLCQK